MAGKPWAYESRSERRRRHIAALQRAASDAFLPLSQGDVSGARQALRGDAGVEPSYEPQMAPETPEQSPSRVNDGAVLEGALKVLQGVRGKADMTGGQQGDGGGWLGKTLGVIDKVTPDAVTDPLGKVLGKGLEYSDKGREYVGGPLFGAVSGLTETERIYDPKTGQYYRKTASFADMGKGLLDAFSQDPRQTYREGKQGYEDYLADPNKSTAHRVIAMGVTDPLTYVGPGAVKGLLRGLPAGAQASKAAKVTSALLESPGRASAGGILGAATGAEVAERAGADPREQMLATLGLGLVGGMAGGGLAGVKRGDVADAFRREAPAPGMVFKTGAPEGVSGPYGGRRVIPDSKVLAEPDAGTRALFDQYRELNTERILLLRKGSLTDAEKSRVQVLYDQRDVIGQQLRARGVDYTTGMGLTTSGTPQPLANERLWFHSTRSLDYDLPDPDMSVGTATGITQGPGVYLAADPAKSAGRYGNRTFVTEFDGNVLDLTAKVAPDEPVFPGGPTWQGMAADAAARLNRAGFTIHGGPISENHIFKAIAENKGTVFVRSDARVPGSSYHWRDSLAEGINRILDSEVDKGIWDLPNPDDVVRQLVGRFGSMPLDGPHAVAMALTQDTMARNGVDAVFHHSPRADGDVLIVLNGEKARVLGDVRNAADVVTSGKTWEEIRGKVSKATKAATDFQIQETRDPRGLKAVFTRKPTGRWNEYADGYVRQLKDGQWAASLGADTFLPGRFDSAEEAAKQFLRSSVDAKTYALTGQKGTFGDVLRESFGGTPLRTAAQSLGGGIYGAMQEDEDPLGGFLFGAGTGLARGILKAPATTGVVTRAVDAAELARDAELGVPDYTNATIFDLPKLERTPPGRVDRAMNAIKRSIQGADAIEMDDVAAPAMRARERLKPVIESQSNILAAKADNIVTVAFKRDAKGRITDLPGAPTVQDVAARLPDFDPFLTPAQREAMAELRSIIEPYSRLLAEANVEFGSRMDIADGGYYLPRGRADLEGADAPMRGGGGRAGGRKGFEKHADFESMQKALDEGYEYSPFAESMRAYGVDAGKRAIDKHISDYFKTVTDEDGNLLASLPSDRMDPVIRGKWKEATGDLVKLRKRLATAEKRAKVAVTAGDEVDDAITQFERGMPDEGMRDLSKLGTRLANEEKRGETLAARAVKEAADKPTRTMTGAGPVRTDMPATPAAQRRADILNARSEEVIRVVNKVDELVPEDVDRLSFLDTAMRRTEKRADVLAKRGGRYAEAAEQIRREIRDLSERVDELRPEYKVALDKSRYLPRGMAYIDMTSLMGTAFPEKMAAAANRFLNAEKPLTGRRAGMTNAIIAANSLLRGLKATGDLSFMGIQGAIGAARDPIGYGRALRAALKSLADPDVLGEYLRDFDANAAKRGRPTSVQWAERGLHIGGNTHEFTIGNSLPSRISGLIEKAPIVKQSNRSFGNFGDALRLQLADAAYGSTLLAKFDMTDAKNLDSIALYANRATGWNPTRFAGDFGDMVMFAPRFFQSQLSFLGMAAAGGNTPGAWEARRSIVQFLGAGTTLTVLANEFSDTPIPTEELFDPNSPNFMRFRFKGQDISLFGPWDSLMRGVSNTARGDYTYMARTKASPVVAQAWNAITGKTFTGEDYYSPGTIFRELALPFSVNDMGIVGGDKGVVGTLVGATGLKSTPMSPTDQLNTLARARFQSDFYDLEPSEQKAIKDAHPDVWERAVERGSALRVQGEEVKTRYIEEQTARDQMLMNGELTLEQWREARDDAYSRKDGEMAQIYRDASFPDRNDVLSRYYDAMDAATVNGVFDPDVRQEFLDSLSEEDRALVERNTGLYATPTEKLFKKLASEYYELPQYRGYTADEARAINDLWQEVRNSARGSDDVYMLRALRQVGQGEDERVIRGVRRRILGLLREDRRRERYKRQHPEIALLTGSGKLTADLAESIRKVA